MLTRSTENWHVDRQCLQGLQKTGMPALLTRSTENWHVDNDGGTALEAASARQQHFREPTAMTVTHAYVAVTHAYVTVTHAYVPM